MERTFYAVTSDPSEDPGEEFESYAEAVALARKLRACVFERTYTYDGEAIIDDFRERGVRFNEKE